MNIIPDIDKTFFKRRLLDNCKSLIEARITAGSLAMSNAQDAANSEEKSSAGDKYETSRARSHLEKDMHSRQLAANRNELMALSGIDYSGIHSTAIAGSFILCDHCSFFIAAGLGKIFFEGKYVYLLSPLAPLAKILNEKKKGSIFLFNKKQVTVIEIF